MRAAIISDLHGNIVALEHVLKEISESNIDRVYCLGDVATLGPQPLKVIHRLQKEKIPCILGNHDEFMLDPNKVREYTKVGIVINAVDWCSNLMGPKEIKFFQGFKSELELKVGKIRVRMFHGSPSSNTEDVVANMSIARLESVLGKTRGDVLVFGHTHLQMLVQHLGRYILNPGSLGSPFKELFFSGSPTVYPFAEYSVLEIKGSNVEVVLKRTYPNKPKLLKSVRDSEYPLKEFLLAQYTRN